MTAPPGARAGSARRTPAGGEEARMQAATIVRAKRVKWDGLRAPCGRGSSARAAIAALALSAAGLAPASAPAAASLPSVSTGPPQHVSFASATLTGTINPHGQDTTYFFQYGPTKAY